MVSLYKRTEISYWVIGALCIAGAVLWSQYFPKSQYLYLIIAVVLMITTFYVLLIISNKLFNDEVTSYMLNCNIHEYMDRLDKRMGKRRQKNIRSLYCNYKAMGFNIIGDYDSAIVWTQQITSPGHKSEYFKRLIEHYLQNDQILEAQDIMNQLASHNQNSKNSVYRASIEINLKLYECRIRVKCGDYDQAEQFYKEMFVNPAPSLKSKLSRVSIACALGNIFVLKGENENAREYLKFASENGGDTKYKAEADKLLSEIG